LTRRRADDAAARGEALARSQEERKRYLAFRLREMYKRGSSQDLRRLAGGEESDAVLRGLEYAAYLSERDAKVLAAYDASASELARAESDLAAERRHLLDLRAGAEAARGALAGKRAEREHLLEGIQGDSKKRVEALGELETASRDLATL